MFCKLELDEKTFKYVKDYLHLWQTNNHQDFSLLDQQIQTDELRWHLGEKKLNNHSEEQLESIAWIKTST